MAGICGNASRVSLNYSITGNCSTSISSTLATFQGQALEPIMSGEIKIDNIVSDKIKT